MRSSQASTQTLGIIKNIVPQMRIGLYIDWVVLALIYVNILVLIPDQERMNAWNLN